MELGNWDDEDLVAPAASNDAGAAAVDDLFEFTDTLRLSDDEDYGAGSSAAPLPPLAKGAVDVTGDRGVVITKTQQGARGNPLPSKEMPYVEMHYTGFLAESGEAFDSSRDQNYAMTVMLDIPTSGKSALIRGLEIGLRELRAGDVATVEVAARYGYGKEGAADIPADADLRFEVEVLDVRGTQKKVEKVDDSEKDLTRLEDVRREREMAQQRREEAEAAKNEEKARKAERAAALKEKLANKNKGGKKSGKKKK